MDVIDEIKQLGPEGFERKLLGSGGGGSPPPAPAPAPVEVSPVARDPSPVAFQPPPRPAQPPPETVVEDLAKGGGEGPEMTPGPVEQQAPEFADMLDIGSPMATAPEAAAPEAAAPELAPQAGNPADLPD